MVEFPQISSVKSTGVQFEKPHRTRRLFGGRVPIPLLAAVILLVAYGLLICWSAVYYNSEYSFSRQLIVAVVGFIVMILLWQFDYTRLAHLSMVFLIISVVLILSPHIPFIGTDAGTGTQSWLNIGVQIQPGEFAKITVILFGASLVARYGGTLNDLREYLKVLVLLIIPFVCIMTQPDLGTGLVYLFIVATVLVMGGARPRYLLISLAVFVAAIVCIFLLDEVLKNTTGEYQLLKQYQRNRLLVFIDPNSDTTDAGYNLAQAEIAIGSGGVFGKGLLNATQSTYGYLPESSTDFIFCVLAEELGFVGVVVLLALYAALVVICIRIARRCDNLFGMLIICSTVGMWLFQILENIGMDCGLMPITGIPLPFVSYGSSFMVVNFVMLGLIGSVQVRENITERRSNYES